MTALKFTATEIDFEFDDELKQPVQLVRSNLEVSPNTYPVEFKLLWLPDGKWNLSSLRWLSERRLPYLPVEAVQKIADLCASVLKPVNVWSSKQGDDGAIVQLNLGRPPEDVRDKIWCSHRPEVLKLPIPSWDGFWDKIERRIKFDEAFCVQGYTEEDLLTALPHLKQAFPVDWVRARYRRAGLLSVNGDMDTEADGYFPAYQLARTACGALCSDPGWKYLVEIGLALEKLKDFDGYNRLKRAVTASSGTQHHLCMAAELLERNLLVGLEPETGRGSARNDLLVQIEEKRCQIELKEFSSSDPVRRLTDELQKKSDNLPETPVDPVIFHVVLADRGEFEPGREAKFIQDVEALVPSISNKISGVVIGRRFLDGSGSGVKREVLFTGLVPSALHPLSTDYLDACFAANFEEIEYPIFGMFAPMHFGSSPKENPNADNDIVRSEKT